MSCHMPISKVCGFLGSKDGSQMPTYEELITPIIHIVLHNLIHWEDNYGLWNFIWANKNSLCSESFKTLVFSSGGHRIECPSSSPFLHIEIQIESANHPDTISINSIHQYVSNISMYRPTFNINQSNQTPTTEHHGVGRNVWAANLVNMNF